MVLLIPTTVETRKTQSTDGYSSSWNACIVPGLKSLTNLTVNAQHRVSRLMVLTRRRDSDSWLSLQVAHHLFNRYRLVK